MLVSKELIVNTLKLAKSLNWEKTVDKDIYPFYVYEKCDKQIKIPREKTYDYIDSHIFLEETIRLLSEDIQETYDSLLFKLENPSISILEFRYSSKNSIDGSLPTYIMDDFSKNIPRLILDTYLNIRNKKTYRLNFPTKDKHVKDLLSRMNYGQTKKGSYIITLHIDEIIEEKIEGGLFSEDQTATYVKENIVIKTIEKVIDSVNTLVDISNENQDLNYLEEVFQKQVNFVNKPLSVNFADSLSQLNLEDDAELHISGFSPLLNNGNGFKKEFRAKPIKKSNKELIKKLVKKYKEVEEVKVTYIGKFFGFDTKSTEPTEREKIWVNFSGYNNEGSADLIEKMICEFLYSDEIQDQINDLIREGRSVKIIGSKEAKKLFDIKEIKQI